MSNWNQVETREGEKFDIVLSWTYEDTLLDDAFDPDCSDIEDMKRRCNDFVDTHYIARVQAVHKGRELGCATLGSCYAMGCEPDDDMKSGLGGYLDDMIAEASKEAEEYIAELAATLTR